MKNLLMFALIFSATAANAGRMDDIIIMADESIMIEFLEQTGEQVSFEVLQRDFVKAEPEMDLALRTDILLPPPARKREWACITQFIKTPKFFEVFKTACN